MGHLITPEARLQFKAGLILTKYYTRATAKLLIGQYPLILFAISLFLFMVAVVPSLRDQLRNSTLLSGATLSLELTGTVYEASVVQGQTVTKPLPGVEVEAGGFKTQSAANGEYRLKILAKGQQNLPVVFSYRGREAISRVSFPSASRIATKDFTFAP